MIEKQHKKNWFLLTKTKSYTQMLYRIFSNIRPCPQFLQANCCSNDKNHSMTWVQEVMHLSFVSSASGYPGNSGALVVIVLGICACWCPCRRGTCTGLWQWLDGDHLGQEFELEPGRGSPVVWGPGLCRWLGIKDALPCG